MKTNTKKVEMTMVRLQKILFFMILVLIVGACKQIAQEESVKVETKGIEEKVTISIDNSEVENLYDLDEFVKGGDPLIVPVTITNNSKYKIFDIDLSFVNLAVTNYNFASNEIGLKQFPGGGGTCQRVLQTKQSCIINLQFTSITSGNIEQDIHITYKNLLKEDERLFKLTILSGTPASLLFDPNENLFKFGSPTGASQKPLIEREYRETQQKLLTIVNKGELRARSISSILSQTCKSYPTNVCPTPPNLGDIAYIYENINCPEVLYANESCQIRVTFTNWNQGTNPLYKEITFQSVVKFDYVKDPLGNTAALNGNFIVISTNIEARFESSLASLTFEEPLTVGNREERVFRAKNTGYQAGILRKMFFYPLGDPNPSFYCQRDAGQVLNCFHMDDTPAVLNDLPFFLVDKENCMSPSHNILVPDNSGCLFGLNFQPSNLKMTSGLEDYEVKFEYDSLFLGQQTIVMNNFVDFLVQASYLSAANVLISGFTVEGNPRTLNKTDINGVEGYDFGRWVLQLAQYHETIDITVSFTNYGDTNASEVVGSDGSANVINMFAVLDLPGFTPSAYQSISLPDAGCGVILPSQTCVLTYKFSPINRSTETETHDSLFDYVAGLKSPDNYKMFNLQYHNGAIFTDSNLTSSTPDMLPKNKAVKLYGIPVTAGQLSKFAIKNIDSPSGNSGIKIGETGIVTYLYRNIGTGTIPYMRFDTTIANNCTGAPNCPAIKDKHNFTYVATDPALLAAESAIDCMDIVNWAGTSSYDDRGDLTVGQTCLISAEFNWENHFVPDQGGYESLYGPLQSFWKRSLNGTMYMYEHELDNYGRKIPSLDFVYFDGDPTNPNISGQAYDEGIASTYSLGDPVYINNNYFKNQGSTFGIEFMKTIHPTPTNPLPRVSALLNREQFTRLSLLDWQGNPVATAPDKVYPEVWLYGNPVMPVYNDVSPWGTVGATSDNNPDYTYAWRSIAQARANNSLCSDCDYSVHLGAFPENVPITFGLSVVNQRTGGAQLKSASYSGDTQFVFTNLASFADLMFDTNTTLDFKGVFTGSGAGVKHGFFYYEVYNQINGGSWTYKVLVTADVVADAPYLSITNQRYDVTTDPGFAPIESIDATINAQATSINADNIPTPHDTTNSVVMQMVKLENITFDSGYIKKRINVTNTSTSKTMNSFDYYLRSATNQAIPANHNAIFGFSWNSNCPSSSSPGSLAPGASCWIDLKYQPDINSTMADYYLTFAYEVNTNRFILQNALIKFEPLSPGQLSMLGYGVPEAVAVGSNVLNGYRIDFGAVTLDTLPKVINYGPITLENDSANLRASLLKQYQVHTSQSDYPTPGSGDDFSGEEYFKIFETSKIGVWANTECFIGEDPGGLEDYEKGFLDDAGATVCNLMIELSLDINTAALILDKADPDVMNGFVAQIPYYSFQRVNVDYLNFFFTGTIMPDGYTKVGDVMDVFGRDDRTGGFSFYQATANSPSVGPIVGYRIYYATNQSALSNVLMSQSLYLPDKFDLNNLLDVNFNSITAQATVERGKFYYFKIVAIRQDPDYDAGRFDGLANGYYLSDGNLPLVRLLIPKFGYAYVHSLNAMINKDVVGGGNVNPVTYSEAVASCSGLNTTFFDNGITKNKSFKLMTSAIWQAVKYDPYASSYSSGVNPLSLPQWTGPSGLDIDIVYSAVTEFDSGEASTCFDSLKTCYLKCDDGCAFDREIVGGFYGAGQAYDYTSYIGETFPLGHPRCYIDVSP